MMCAVGAPAAYPFERVRRVARADAAALSAAARWLDVARPLPDDGALARLVGGPVGARVVGSATGAHDPHAATCEVHVAGAVIAVSCASSAVRALAQRVLGGPDELAAPRPLGAVERALLALAIASALDDLGVAGEVWPVDRTGTAGALAIELALELAGAPATVIAHVPRDLALRVAPRPTTFAARAQLELVIVVGRCALPAAALAQLAVRDVITLERARGDAELVLDGGAIGVSAARGAVDGIVATGYVRRDMSLPDDAHVELTVALGTTRLSLRQLAELAVGSIVPLGRPLAGPFELRAAGRVLGRGELVDIDGELGVRIISLEE